MLSYTDNGSFPLEWSIKFKEESDYGAPIFITTVFSVDVSKLILDPTVLILKYNQTWQWQHQIDTQEKLYLGSMEKPPVICTIVSRKQPRRLTIKDRLWKKTIRLKVLIPAYFPFTGVMYSRHFQLRCT